MRFQVFLGSFPGSCFPRRRAGLAFLQIDGDGHATRYEWSNLTAPEFLSLLPIHSFPGPQGCLRANGLLSRAARYFLGTAEEHQSA